MGEEQKKPGVAFWATVALALVIAYPLSFGPACWIYSRLESPETWETFNRFYCPILLAWWKTPAPIDSAIEWYANVGAAIELNMAEDDDGHLYVVPIRVEIAE